MKRAWMAAAALAVALAWWRAPSGRASTAAGAISVEETRTPAPAQAREHGRTRATRTIAIGAVAAPRIAGEVIVRGGWGSKPGELGRRRDPESNPEAPMAIAVGARGEVLVLDQVNRRVQRFVDGKWAANLALGGDTAQDLALAPGGRVALLDRLGDRAVRLYDAAGNLQNELALDGDAGAATGVFADDRGVYVERNHSTVVRVASADGQRDDSGATLDGRPTRDGRLLIRAALSGPASAQVIAVDRSSGAEAWRADVGFGARVLHLVLLDSDARGAVYLAADDGDESAGYGNEQIELVRLDGGAPAGRIALPPPPTADESFRPITIGDDGAVYAATAAESGFTIVRYVF